MAPPADSPTSPRREIKAVEDADSRHYEAKLRDIAGLRAQLARVTGSVELAADLLHDAFVTALQKLRAGELADPSHLDGYVYRVALNHYRNFRRKDRHTALDAATADVEDVSARPAEAAETAQWARVVAQLLREVTPVRDREILVRFYLYEEDKDELCRRFALSELHFNRVIHRARDRFRELLQRRGFGKSDFLSIAAILVGTL